METAPPAPAPRAAKVLVVDDDPGIRDVLIDYLSRQGFDARGAADGREMDQALARDPADVVVLDLDTASADAARETASEMCRKLLANPVTEDFEIAGVSSA